MRKPVIILVRTQLEENLGFVGRVISNLGFHELRLVDPICHNLDPKALCVATEKGEDIIRSALVYPNIENAIRDIDFLVAFSARARSLRKAFIDSYNVFDVLKNSKKSAFIFGPEKNGLTNEDLLYADVIAGVPVSEKCPSINLSHSVTIACYEFNRGLYFNNCINKCKSLDSLPPNANKDEIKWMLEHMIAKLDQKGFFRQEEKKAAIKQKIKNIFVRSALSTTEVQIMNGIVKCLSGDFEKFSN